MSTYSVKSGWKKRGSKGYKEIKSDGTIRRWQKRRHVAVYEYGNPTPIRTSYEYKGLIKDDSIPKESLTVKTPIVSGSSSPVDYLASEDPFGAAQQAALAGGITYETDPSGLVLEKGYEIQTSGQTAYLDKFTQYLDSVDFYNNDLRSKLEMFFELDQIKYGYDEPEKDEKIEKEFKRHEIRKRSYAEWAELTNSGIKLDVPELYQPPTMLEETSEWERFVNEFQYGANWMWQPIKQTGIPQILAMGLAGMPSYLTKSMLMSTQMMGTMNRLAGAQDASTAMLGNIQDAVLNIKPGTDTENYKALYTALNEQAKRRGIIKGDWTLRLSRNIPVKQRWKRLYVTLAAHIEKQGKK